MKETSSLLAEHEQFFSQKDLIDTFLLIDTPDEFKCSLEELFYYWISNNPDISQESRSITTSHFRAFVALLDGLTATKS